MFRLFASKTHAITLARQIHRGGHWITPGNFTYVKDFPMYFYSQRQAAKALGVSANTLSKHLSGKLPKLYV